MKINEREREEYSKEQLDGKSRAHYACNSIIKPLSHFATQNPPVPTIISFIREEIIIAQHRGGGVY
jgi:hypothetical protein